MKKQVVVIHGGGSFIPKGKDESILDVIARKNIDLDKLRYKTGWKVALQEDLGDEYDVLAPRMPNKDTPEYKVWKAWFERILPLLNKDALFVGHSLGGLFLAKYFSDVPKWEAAPAVFLVAAVYGVQGYGWELQDVSPLNQYTQNLFLYHSKDDAVVPFSDFEKFKHDLPSATVRELDGLGHINQEHFPELIEDIKTI